jgi:hypothetical protein
MSYALIDAEAGSPHLKKNTEEIVRENYCPAFSYVC